jgi:hypothetical protein
MENGKQETTEGKLNATIGLELGNAARFGGHHGYN